MKREVNLTQPQRLTALIIDLAIVAFACWWLFGHLYPPPGDKGFWAYSALLAVLIGAKLGTPFYVRPADAISYAVPALVSLMLINNWNAWSAHQRWGFSLAAGFSLFVVILGVANIVVNSLEGDRARSISNRTRILVELIARPEFIYAPLIIFALFSYHRDSWTEAVTICIVTGVTVWWSAGDFLLGGLFRLRSLKGISASRPAGELFAFQDPGIVLLRQQAGELIAKNDLLIVSDRHGPKRLVVALDYAGRSEGILVRAAELKVLSEASESMIGPMPADGFAYPVDGTVRADLLNAEGIEKDTLGDAVGLVAPDTSIQRLYFEVVDNSDLEEGRLVSAWVDNRKVMYQIAAGTTKEELVQHKNTLGYVRGQAQQVGEWDASQEKFTNCRWLPTLNSPVFLEKTEEHHTQADSIGHFPRTNMHAKIKSISDLVSHNTAILGILGVGKSMLGIEIVERIMAEGIKVICLDLTNQYAEQLADFYDTSYEQKCLATLQAAAAKDREEFHDNPEEGGSVTHLRRAVMDDLAEFLRDDNPRLLKIYNPTAFAATKQEHEPKTYKNGNEWIRTAALFSVTPVEVTQIISESALSILSNKMSANARACLVYEEAHSLVPEWNSVVNESDKRAVSGSARAILQGRKYGLGCLLITQRTANVTKSILNQCNTIFAMRTFDETGKEFLSSYIGQGYADSLSSIPERHAILFGKASSCENPVLIRLNDQDEFRAAFRAIHPPPPKAASEPAQNPAAAVEPGKDLAFDDEAPF